jgi:hypothetical protein
MSIVEGFTPQKGQVVTATRARSKSWDVSADGEAAAIQPFSLSKQMLLGSVMKNILQHAAPLQREP